MKSQNAINRIRFNFVRLLTDQQAVNPRRKIIKEDVSGDDYLS